MTVSMFLVKHSLAVHFVNAAFWILHIMCQVLIDYPTAILLGIYCWHQTVTES